MVLSETSSCLLVDAVACVNTNRPNTYLDDPGGKIVIYSRHMAARREKSGKRGISSCLAEGKSSLSLSR
jgi:hypothetical protein